MDIKLLPLGTLGTRCLVDANVFVYHLGLKAGQALISLIGWEVSETESQSSNLQAHFVRPTYGTSAPLLRWVSSHCRASMQRMLTMSVDINDILALTVSERIRLVEEIWDRIATSPDQIPLTPAQRKELDRRKREHQRDPSAVKSWPEVKISTRTAAQGNSVFTRI